MIFHALGMQTMGDVMAMMNIAHAKTHIFNANHNTIIFHWFTPEGYQYHFEDPETIQDRIDYIHNFYSEKKKLKIVHQYEDPINEELYDFLFQYRIVTEHDYNNREVKANFWTHRPDASRIWKLKNPYQITYKKVVFWRPTFNADLSRVWKRALSHEDWSENIEYLKKMGYEIVELTYRTPIREAWYHLCTCEYAMYYDGMWHHMSTGLFKPSIVVGMSSIAYYNSVNAIPVRTPNEFKRILRHWNQPRKIWNVSKKHPTTQKTYDIEQFTWADCTAQEWIRRYNRKIQRAYMYCYSNKLDWTLKPHIPKVMHDT